ncbi:MAG: DEAD/DEAH box helicase family protein, partial [Actinobacteria bacterium]|nr:DEAD/DEAH box helicase family protein [Actinomycetota bacterium]
MPDGQVTEQNPIINDPYAEPTRHWRFGEGAPEVAAGRRLSGHLPPGDTKSGELSVTGELIPIALVNDLRERVGRWRTDDYPGVTAVTRDLFASWFDPEREPGLRPFFAQREAIETIVFLTEAPPDRRVGVDVPRTEAYERWAIKMATGSGKTLVMAMLIAWSALNKAANRQDTRFADAVLVVCPNLTVKERLAELDPHSSTNAYRAFDLIPPNLASLLGQARVLVTNWHQLAPAGDPKRSVLRRGAESPAAFCRRVLGQKLGTKRRLLVLNDEAHHAYRHRTGTKVGRDEQADVERATVWIDGLERVHHDREILRCIDLSATPMHVPGSGHDPWKPFEWIVSDFALVDAIESGLVKVPRIP